MWIFCDGTHVSRKCHNFLPRNTKKWLLRGRNRDSSKNEKTYEPIKGKHVTIDTALDPEKKAKLVSSKIPNSTT